MTTDEKPALSTNEIERDKSPIPPDVPKKFDVEKAAQRLNKLSTVHAIYAVLDASSLAYSGFKISCDMLCGGKSSDAADFMHDRILTTEGIIGLSAEAIALIGFSLLGTIYNKKDPNEIKRFFAKYWPYCRDLLKGVKNSYKGIQFTAKAFNAIGVVDCRHLVMPLTFGLGATAVIGRAWLRYSRDLRKEMQTQNSKLLNEVWDLKLKGQLDENTRSEIRNAIKKEGAGVRKINYMASVYDGFINGLYLFMGSVTLVDALSMEWLFTVMVLSVLFSALFMVARVYEEYAYQRDLDCFGERIELILCEREAEELFQKLTKLSQEAANNTVADIAASIERSKKEISQQLSVKIAQFQAYNKKLHPTAKVTYGLAALKGLQNGLAVYGVLSSLLIAINTIMTLTCGTGSLPPLVLIVSVLLGLACLVGFIGYALVENWNTRRKNKTVGEREEKHEKLSELIALLNRNHEIVGEAPSDEREPYSHSLAKDILTFLVEVEIARPDVLMDWAEVFRSLFSGIKQGPKPVEMVCAPLQELDQNHHYQDTQFMALLAVSISAVFAGSFALRNFARFLGRDKPGRENKKSEPQTPPPEPAEDGKQDPSSQVDDGVGVGALSPYPKASPLPSPRTSLGSCSMFSRKNSLKRIDFATAQTEVPVMSN